MLKSLPCKEAFRQIYVNGFPDEGGPVLFTITKQEDWTLEFRTEASLYVAERRQFFHHK